MEEISTPSSKSLQNLYPDHRALPHPYICDEEALPPFPTVHAAFFQHAQLRPLNTALIDHSSTPERKLTYGELARHASEIADQLISAGVKENQRVPLVIHRSLEMAVGILGILMAGAQYILLDSGYIQDKKFSSILSDLDGNTPIVTTSTLSTRVRLDGSSRRTLLVDIIIESRLTTHSSPSPVSSQYSRGDGSSGCYAIYTAGPTNHSRGVDVTHSNAVNLLCQSPGNLGMSPGVKVGSVQPLGSDMGAWEILGAFCNGAILVMRGSDWVETLREIEILVATPTILARFDPQDYPNIRVVASRGDQMLQSTADTWVDANKTLLIGYGTPEVTIVNTLSKHTSGMPVCMGRPTPNNTIYILDENKLHVNMGKVGKIWAGGSGVARGYIGTSELNVQWWWEDPFINDGFVTPNRADTVHADRCTSSMMFNTGNLGYWLRDGSLQTIRRQDDLVRSKEVQVELDRVVTTLLACDGVSGAVAIFYEKQLHAFITPSTCSVGDVMNEVKRTLPRYAVPQFCIPIDQFPQTHNGKVDQDALRSLVKDLDQAYDNCVMTTSDRSPFSTKASTINGDSYSLPEKQMVKYINSTTTDGDTELPVPAKNWPKWARNLRLRIFIVYRTIFTLVWLSNVAALVCLLSLDANTSIWLGRLAYINLTIAVLIRQDHVVNVLYSIACAIPQSWPAFIRLRAAKIYHFGGTHSGFASCAIAWYTASLVVSGWTRVNVQTATTGSVPWLVLSFLALGLLFGVAGVAYPRFRKVNHNSFELIHRFFGWSALILIWITTLLLVRDNRKAWPESHPNSTSTPPYVDAELMSDHAVRLHFSYTVPVNGSFVRISTRPLLEWHSFAPIPAPEAVNGRPKGFSLIVSNAGDWTRDIISKPRAEIWVRGVPTCGVMRVAPLFRSLILIGTGSGIGPLLGFIQRPTCPYRLIWSTKDPVKTFGQDICNTIMRQDPNAIIWDTRARGRPDLVALAWREREKFGAEGVLIIANEKITKKVVYGLESRGVPAFGAIWDS
ncbi:putative NRPS-like enzyme [Pseudovirgaria hyperparasitica]|uniref:Putative NRPS-like enzyme n=1 Tax=Pseudovirgaria hyperparasitica TaxID=470096 RepID=A0A6A6W5N8_9PEZI|nr:putative NRPS-like enzyme [Pseudovirgaria hyperparasitica]KAF2757344.1 putative NRPS-like enzyme [Pseudovirgaria hyperparasitica]